MAQGAERRAKAAALRQFVGAIERRRPVGGLFETAIHVFQQLAAAHLVSLDDAIDKLLSVEKVLEPEPEQQRMFAGGFR